MRAIDNPLNGYTDDEYLGMFLLSPGTIKARNEPPISRPLYWIMLTQNRFIDWDIEDMDI